ncbi:unnamed protein product, partial [marine sediment metagenome]
SDQDVSTGSLVALDGSDSSDADGDTLTYSWSFTSMPVGSGATLSDATVVNPSFTADVNGTYVISLVVNDGTVDSSPNTVTITSTTPFLHWDMPGTGRGYEFTETVKLLESKGYTELVKTSYQELEDSNLQIYTGLYTNEAQDKAAILEYIVNEYEHFYRGLVTEILPTGEALVYDFTESAPFKISQDGTLTELSILSSNNLKLSYELNEVSLNQKEVGDPCSYLLDTNVASCMKDSIISSGLGALNCLLGGPFGELLT